MESSARYVAQDRRAAIERGEALPEDAEGAALFADIAGFTAWTARLHAELGARRGAEEAAARIDEAYGALVAAIEHETGSVVGFAGDALICWFDGRDDGLARAQRAAAAMLAAMAGFEGIRLKIGIGKGGARRLVVGDPAIQLLDLLAGPAVVRMCRAQGRARPGETEIDAADVELTDDAAFQRLDAIGRRTSSGGVLDEPYRRWILPAVHRAEGAGRGAFLLELRPTTALFVGFDGLDFGRPGDAARLDDVVRQVQHVALRHEGTLLQLTVDDKGCYAYVCFGAPVAHEDDRMRAVRAAWQLREALRPVPFLAGIRIGVATGVARTGAYGSRTRATYGALGDHVNVAARLMNAARGGEILVSAGLRDPAGQEFALAAPRDLALKGHAALEPASALLAPLPRRTFRTERAWSTRMIGRAAELARAAGALDAASRGQSQVIAIRGDPGIGKSRLVAAIIDAAEAKGFEILGGSGSASATTTPYHAWKPILRALLRLDEAAAAADGETDTAAPRRARAFLRHHVPHREAALPVLAAALDETIEDNEYTRVLDPEARASLLAAVVEETVREVARRRPLALVVDDAHWIDAASRPLLDRFARPLRDGCLCLIVASRPWDDPMSGQADDVTRLELDALSAQDASELVLRELAGLPLPPTAVRALADSLNRRAQGNAYYLEELARFIRERALSEQDVARISADLPESLQALILSRVDTLTEAQHTALKAASIVGRVFRAAWLQGYCPALGPERRLRGDLDELRRMDITPLDQPEPDLSYLFKHIITHEVVYESMPAALRAALHDDLAGFLEARPGESDVNLLAFHYGRGRVTDKQRLYFAAAADAAEAQFANEAALAYLDRLLPLLQAREQRHALHLRRARLLSHVARHAEAEAAARAALALADDASGEAAALLQIGESQLYLSTSDLALETLRRAEDLCVAGGDRARQSEALMLQARVVVQIGKLHDAAPLAGRALEMAAAAGHRSVEARVQSNLGLVMHELGDADAGLAATQRALALALSLGDVRLEIATLLDLAMILIHRRAPEAEQYLRQALARSREIGFAKMLGTALNALGIFVAHVLHEDHEARQLFADAIDIHVAMDMRREAAGACLNLGNLEKRAGDFDRADALIRRSLALFEQAGLLVGIAHAQRALAGVLMPRERFDEARPLLASALSLHQRENLVPQVSFLHGYIDYMAQCPQAARYKLDTIRLCAAVRRLGADYRQPTTARGSHELELDEALAREGLAPAQVEDALREGAAMSLAGAIQLALNAVSQETAAPAESQETAARAAVSQETATPPAGSANAS